jgi:hypothetical protein
MYIPKVSGKYALRFNVFFTEDGEKREHNRRLARILQFVNSLPPQRAPLGLRQPGLLRGGSPLREGNACGRRDGDELAGNLQIAEGWYDDCMWGQAASDIIHSLLRARPSDASGSLDKFFRDHNGRVVVSLSSDSTTLYRLAKTVEIVAMSALAANGDPSVSPDDLLNASAY